MLFYPPAALGGSSALRAWELRRHGDGDDGPIRVCVDGRRSVRSRPGITVERMRGWKGRTQLHLSPPRLRLEHALELDGRLGHEEALDRWADLDRDLDSAVAGDLTLRAGWAQILDPCRVAAVVGRILVARGWVSTLRGCRPGCPVGDLAISPAPGAGEVAAS